MPSSPTLELISFKVCPFVQRAAIALNEKNVEYKITHINLADTPDWFKEISPLGKVPLLRVDDDVIFESAVIMEYLDEVCPPSLHPANPLTKAHHRGWIEFCSNLIMTQFKMLGAPEKKGFESMLAELKEGLEQVGDKLSDSQDFFADEGFSLVDTAYAPIFMRLEIVLRHFDIDLELSDRMQKWSDALLKRPSIQQSVVDDFETVFLGFVASREGYVNQIKK